MDNIGSISSIADAGYLDIQPAAGVEWIVLNIYHENDVELYFYDGTNDLKFDSTTGAGVYARQAFHVTNSVRIRVKNVSGGSQLLGYDGIVSKES